MVNLFLLFPYIFKFIRAIVARGGICLMVVMAGLFITSDLMAQPMDRQVHIAILNDGTAVGFSDQVIYLKKEIRDLTAADFDLTFSIHEMAKRSDTATAIKESMDALLNDRKVDLVIALGVLSSNEVLKRTRLKKPVIATVIIDPKTQGLPRDKDASGVFNLTYVNTVRNLVAEMAGLNRVVSVKKAVVIEDRGVHEIVPMLKNRFDSISKKYGIDFEFISADLSAQPILDALPSDIDAVIVTPFLRLDEAESKKLILGLIKKRLPGFSLWGERWVKAGLLAGVCPDVNLERIIRRVALDVLQILQGSDAGSLKVDVAVNERLMINTATADKTGVELGWRLRTEALLFSEREKKSGQGLDFAGTVKQAVIKNFEIAADIQAVLAGREDVRMAAAHLLPQLDLSTTGSMIDQDRAAASFGLYAERRWSGSASLSQVIYSDKAWTHYGVQKDLYLSKVKKNEVVKLDIGAQAAVTYLNLLKTDVLVNIREENLKLSRANLVRAQHRTATGMAGPAEVYRWESEVARSKKELLAAMAGKRQVQIGLNHLLARDLETPFSVLDVMPDDPLFITFCGKLFDNLTTRNRLVVFQSFMMRMAEIASPELQQLSAVMAAAEKSLAAASRARWTPTVVLQGEITRYFAESGAGTTEFPPGFPVYDLSSGQALPTSQVVPFPDISTDDLVWNVGIKAMFDLYSGGEIRSATVKAERELRRIKIMRKDAVHRLETAVRTIIFAAGASYPAIELAKESVDAAIQNLELVTDAYERGVVSIITLLDAQNAALISQQVAATSRYDFLIDMVKLQRAVARPDCTMTRSETGRLSLELDGFFKKAGIHVDAFNGAGLEKVEGVSR